MGKVMVDRTLTEELATFIVDTDTDSIPEDVYGHAKVCFQDWLGVAVAGANEPLVGKLRAHSDRMGGYEQASLIGYWQKKNVEQAAMINGAASHALDYDDSSMSMIGHPSVVLFPGTLALAEWRSHSGRDFLTAFIVGLQVASTLGECVGKSHYMKGWHATSTLGHVGAAAAAARLLGLNREQTLNALGIAATQAGGLKRVFGTMCKPFHAGNAAANAVSSVLLAEDGFTSANNIIEGPFGFLSVMASENNVSAFDHLARQWDIDRVAQKYHASCHGTHAPIEAALEVVKTNCLAIEDIQSIHVSCSHLAVDAASILAPQTGLEGKFSINYCVANALLRGHTGMQAFTDEKVHDLRGKALYENITVIRDDRLGELESRVVINTKSGQTLTGRVDVMTNIPPLSVKAEKIQNKVLDILEPVWGRSKASAVLQTLSKLETVDTMADLMRQLKD